MNVINRNKQRHLVHIVVIVIHVQGYNLALFQMRFLCIRHPS